MTNPSDTHGKTHGKMYRLEFTTDTGETHAGFDTYPDRATAIHALGFWTGRIQRHGSAAWCEFYVVRARVVPVQVEIVTYDPASVTIEFDGIRAPNRILNPTITIEATIPAPDLFDILDRWPSFGATADLLEAGLLKIPAMLMSSDDPAYAHPDETDDELRARLTEKLRIKFEATIRAPAQPALLHAPFGSVNRQPEYPLPTYARADRGPTKLKPGRAYTGVNRFAR